MKYEPLRTLRLIAPSFKGVLDKNRLCFKKICKYRLKTKIMFKLVSLGYIGIHISNIIVIDCGIEIF